MRIGVECYSGYRADESPRRLILGKRTVAVKEILDRWLGEEHRYFKILGEDGCTYLIRQDQGADIWELVMYDHGPL
jgi:hypothetical protein